MSICSPVLARSQSQQLTEPSALDSKLRLFQELVAAKRCVTRLPPSSGKVTRMVHMPFFTTFPCTKFLITSWDSSFCKSVMDCATEIRFPSESRVFCATTPKSSPGPPNECQPLLPPELASRVCGCFFFSGPSSAEM